jgi:hypothetical protein
MFVRLISACVFLSTSSAAISQPIPRDVWHDGSTITAIERRTRTIVMNFATSGKDITIICEAGRIEVRFGTFYRVNDRAMLMTYRTNIGEPVMINGLYSVDHGVVVVNQRELVTPMINAMFAAQDIGFRFRFNRGSEDHIWKITGLFNVLRPHFENCGWNPPSQ